MGRRLVLALDGSTGVCSTALLALRVPHVPLDDACREPVAGRGDRWAADRWEVVASRSEADGRAQAKVLLRLVDEMLEEAGRRPEDLGAVVVGKGPGTFTGVRVTVATARALSLALATPVVGVSTLGALAAVGGEAAAGMPARRTSTTAPTGAGLSSSLGEVDVIVPVVDARRGQVFYGLYRAARAPDRSDSCIWRRTREFGVCDRGALGEVVPEGGVVVIGEERLRPEGLAPGVFFVSCDVVAQYLVVGQSRLDEPGLLPEGRRLMGWLARALVTEGSAFAGRRAGHISRDRGTSDVLDARGVLDSFVPGAVGSPESVAPVYVRSPDADIHITRMRDPWADGSNAG